MPDDAYIHGTSPGEQARLARMNALLNPDSLSALALAGGERILDVGSGLGQLARAMGKASGRRVLGIERDDSQRETAVRLAREAGEEDFVEFRSGDAAALPLSPEERGTFDVAHARFVLEHVRDPLAVVHAMSEAVRPGGRIVLEDDDHDLLRLWPAPDGFEALWREYMRSYERIGRDPVVGRRLVALLHEAGIRSIRNRLLFFGGCAGSPDFPFYAENLATILEEASDLVCAGGSIDARAFAAALTGLREWAKRPDAAIWYVRNWAAGRKP